MSRETFSSRSGFTLVELLVVIAIISVISGLVIPGLIEARRKALITQCTSNLKQIYTYALAYSDKWGEGSFPFGKTRNPRAHESLNEMVQSTSDGEFAPSLFCCPSADEKAAVPDEKGNYVLEEGNLSYAWTAQKLKNTKANRALACCKHVDGHVDEDGEHPGHKKGVCVLYTDGSVRFVTEDKLDQETMLLAGLTR